MKYIIKNIVILFVISVLLFSCKMNAEKRKVIGNENVVIDSSVAFRGDTTNENANNIKKKHRVNSPDYIPPIDGGNNEKWCYNRHKILKSDSNCYFGKGLQKRNRYRWGRQN